MASISSPPPRTREEAAARAAELANHLKAVQAIKSCYYWLTECTKSKDEQALARGLEAYRPFPKEPYIQAYLAFLENEPLGFTRKSRTMMCSWTVAGWAAHKAFTNPATKVVFQSEDEDRSINLINYAKVLWEQSLPELQKRWPLSKKLELQPGDSLALANGSELTAIVGNPKKVRSAHPTIYVLDEAAHVEQGEESWNVAMMTQAPWMHALSSVFPGWYEDLTEDAKPVEWPGYMDSDQPPGILYSRTEKGWPVLHVHYTADPRKRDPEWLEREKRKATSPSWWDIEMEMKAHARSGQLIYPEWDQRIHVIPDHEIPERLCRYMAIDPHPRTPHAFLWVGIDKWSDWYVYKEMWPSVVYGKPVMVRDDQEESSYTIRDYCETIAFLEGNRIEWRHPETDQEYGVYTRGNYFGRPAQNIIARYMDQAGKGFRASGEGQEEEFYSTRYTKFGLSCLDPKKSHKSGEDAIRMLLKPRHHDFRGQWPRIHVAASCVELQLEFRRHRYKPTRRPNDERELRQEGVEARCHLLDLLRYLATAPIGWNERLAS